MYEGRIADAPTDAAGVTSLIDAVNSLSCSASDADLIDTIRTLEHLKASCAAAQARLTHAFTTRQLADAAARKLNRDRTRQSVAAQVALARRDSQHRGQRHLGIAHALVSDLPHTLAALSAGQLNEHRARIIVEQFACLTPGDRIRADIAIASDLPSLGDRTAQSRAAGIAYRIDPEAVMGKVRGAVTDRHVTLRPAPDTMTRLSALLPVACGVAVYAALRQHADSTTASGDSRTRGQIMADHLVAQVTDGGITGCDAYGAPTHDDTPGDAPTTGSTGGVQLNLIMTDRSLLDDDNEPAHLVGHGSIPAALARALVIGNADSATRTWVRRLYTDPTSGQLAAMDSHQRLFPVAAQRFLLLRDQVCRTPWCDAPIRHADHITPHSEGGRTDIRNGQGLCQACNHSKQAPGWIQRSSVRHSDQRIHTTTPTGHRYISRPPPPPRSEPWPDISRSEHRLVQVLFDTG